MTCYVLCPYCKKKTMLTVMGKSACFRCGEYFIADGEIVFKGTIRKMAMGEPVISNNGNGE